MDEAPEKTTKRIDVPRYFRLACQFWWDESVVGWTDQMKLLFLYLLTTKHRTLEGIFVLPLEYVAADMRWPITRVRKILAKLEGMRAVKFDPGTNLLLIRNALRYQQPDSKNVLTAVLSRVRNLPDQQELLNEFIDLAELHCRRSGLSAFAQALPERLKEELRAQPKRGVFGAVGTERR
ncbi:MAG: hypothetical protein OEY28_02470 [Nitrospira sp.]|nr:hypothetical protein [Nitrospira sp.]